MDKRLRIPCGRSLTTDRGRYQCLAMFGEKLDLTADRFDRQVIQTLALIDVLSESALFVRSGKRNL